MRKSRFTDSQIMDTFKRAEAGVAVPDLCGELGVCKSRFYKWRSKFGWIAISMISYMKELEEENSRLRWMYFEERGKSEIVAEALTKQWFGYLDAASWPNDQSRSAVYGLD